MVNNEGMIHKELKKWVIEHNSNYVALEEARIGKKRIDIIFTDNDGNIKKLVECIATQSLKEAMDKLSNINLNSILIEKEIVREYKEKNQKARKIIKSIEEKGIKFIEVRE